MTMDETRGRRAARAVGASGTSSRPRRCSDDGGAALVEAAIITPVFMLMALGLIEYGLVFRDYVALGNATSSATRTLSIWGNAWDADYQTLQAAKKDLAAVPTGSIQRIVVFKATSGTDTSSWAGCKTGASTTNVCNVYTPVDWNRTPVNTWFGCGVGSIDSAWCPTSRDVAVATSPDYAGVYVRINHTYVTKLFGNSVTLDNFVISRLEPQDAA